MEVKGKKIGFVLTGSFSIIKKTIPHMKKLKKMGAELLPIMSENAYTLNTKFGNTIKYKDLIENICEKKIIHTIIDAEPIGPKHLTDIIIVAPASR